MLNAEEDWRTSIHQTYLIVFVPLFSKPILTKQNIAYAKNSQQFLASQGSALKTLVLGNLFEPFRLVITFAPEVWNLEIKMKKNKTIVFFSLSPIANCSCECDGRSNKLEQITKYKGFSCSHEWSVEVLSWWLYFSSRREPLALKLVGDFCGSYILLCWEFFSKREGQKRSNFSSLAPHSA